MRLRLFFILAVTVVLIGCAGQEATPTRSETSENLVADVAKPTAVVAPVEDETPLYFVADYDEDRDPAEDLQEAIAEAQASNRRIILEIGGDWCIDCHILEGFLEEREAVATQLKENFVIVKVNLSTENLNEEFLAHYPEVTFVPHFFVLESNGDFLYSQGTEELESGDSYSAGRFIAFVDRWGPQ